MPDVGQRVRSKEPEPVPHTMQSLLTIERVWTILIGMLKLGTGNRTPVDILILLGAFVNLLVVGGLVAAYLAR